MGQGWWVGFVALVSFVVEQRRRVEPRSARRARKEDGKDRAMGELSEQAVKRMNEMKSAQAANDPK